MRKFKKLINYVMSFCNGVIGGGVSLGLLIAV